MDDIRKNINWLVKQVRCLTAKATNYLTRTEIETIILDFISNKNIKTLISSDFTSNNYNITSSDLEDFDIIKIDSGIGNVAITFPSGLSLNKEVDIYNLDNEVTLLYTAYSDTKTPITVMNVDNTAITVTTSTSTELLIIGLPD